MKLSLVNQPWTIAAPPKGSDSTGIWSYQVSRRLVEYYKITYYGCKSQLNHAQESNSSLSPQIKYRGISRRFDSLLKIPRAIAKRLNTNSLLPYFASNWFHYGYGWQVARDAAQRGSDIIHIHNHSQFVPIVRKYNPNAKIVLHLHCEWVNRLNQEAIAERLAKLDLVISCSDYITNKIAARFPEYAGICRTVNNGVDANYFVPATRSRPQNSQDAPQMLFVGRISPEKGVHDLIDAFIQVTATYPDAVLTIIGPHIIVAKEMLFDLQHEPEVQALEPYYGVDYLEYVKSKIPPHLCDQVIFTGSLSQEQVLPYYQQADVVINPSLSEAFGMSLVEAMATQTPVVATKIGGMTEIVNDGVTGLLSDPGDIQALASAITAIISEPEIASQMGKAGRKRVLQYYTWEQITQSLIFNYATMGVNIKVHDSKKKVARSLSKAN